MKKLKLITLLISLLLAFSGISYSQQPSKIKPKKNKAIKKTSPDCAFLFNISELKLDRNEIQLGENLGGDSAIVKVSLLSSAMRPEDYIYKVSGGKVIVSDASISWDMGGLPAGTYTINVGIKEGLCSAKITEKTASVTIKPAEVLTTPQNTNGVPPGLVLSNEPAFGIGPSTIGRRRKRSAPDTEAVKDRADVTGLRASREIVFTICSEPASQGAGCKALSGKIEITINATNPKNDVLIYNYTVSGGKIIGSGSSVTWDLSDAKPGDYTITAAVDNGCDFCGKTITRTVTISEIIDKQD